jgi:hypothetical protein
MLTSLLHLLANRAPAEYEQAFIQEVTVKEPVPRNSPVERLILGGWLLIVVKCFAVIWAINHWAVPFHPCWIILPTVFMAALVTAVYLWQR